MLNLRDRARKGTRRAQDSLFRISILCSMFYVLCVTPGILFAVDADYIQIVETSPDHLVIEFRMPELKVDTRKAEGQTFQVLSFSGCSFTYEVGKPQIPIRVVTLGIPGVSEPSVSVLDTEPRLLTDYMVYPVENSVIKRKPGLQLQDGGAPFPTPGVDYASETEFVMDRESYRERRFYPATLAEIKPVGYVRQQRMARLVLHPIQYSPSTGQLKVHENLRVRVSFAQHKGMAPSRSSSTQYSAPGADGAFEDIYQNSLLNYDQAKSWRSPRVKAEPSRPRMAPSQGVETKYKLTITQNGMYKLDYDYLARAGIDPGSIDPQRIHLQSGGEDVPIYVEGYQDGVFDPDDFIEFYAVKAEGIFTNENVYWLSWGTPGSTGAKSLMVAIKDGTPKTPGLEPPEAFLDTEHWEPKTGRDLVFYDPLREVTSESADHFFWMPMRGQDPKYSHRRDIPLDLLSRAQNISELFTLRVCFQGITYARGSSSHEVAISLNGSLIDTATWEGQAEHINETTLSQVYLNRYNWFELHCRDDNGTYEAFTRGDSVPEWDLFLNWIEIDYWRSFSALNDRLEFSTETVPPAAQTVQYKVTDFSGPDIEVFQIDRSGAVARIINPRVERNGDIYNAVFEDNVNQPSRYFAARATAMRRPDRIVKDEPSILHDPANRVDYIMITHRNFRESADRLADFRRRQELDAIVVDVEDIYDEFSYGVFDPVAIQRFLRYAYFNWDKIPTYVTLMGDAHWDYEYAFHHIYLGYENYPRIYVPTYHVHSAPYGQTAMDQTFVTVSGNDVLPDMLLGRIPVETAEEADNAVDKIIAYEERPNRGQWQSRILLAADDEKSKSGDEIFEDSRIELVDGYIPIGYQVLEVYLRRIGEPYLAKQRINEGIHNGVLILEYAGHGGAQSWAHEQIFYWGDVKKLRNHEKYPFAVTTTCLNGYFDNPTGKSIMELLITQPNGGSFAGLSATRLTYGAGNASFDKILYTKIFRGTSSVLGKIVTEAKIDFINMGINAWIPSARQYTLFGDPASRLALPELNIECELAISSVDSSTPLQLRAGSIRRPKLNPLTGENELVTDAGFSSQMQISVTYPNNLDDDETNDLPIQESVVGVWKGKFETVQISLPPGVISGDGLLKCYSFNGDLSAIGGVRFSVSKPVIEFYTHTITDDESLQIHAAVVDNLGPGGIESVKCEWRNTQEWKPHADTMKLSGPPPGAPEVGGLWYALESGIPFSAPGSSIEYNVVVVDTDGNVVESPPQLFKVPIGVNLAISRPEPSMLPVIEYSYFEGALTLSALVENNGGKEVKRPVAIYFFEGNPDRNKDSVIDSDAEVLGSAIIEYDQWKKAEDAIQITDALVKLDVPLSPGIHQIFAWVNPRTSSSHSQPGIERVEDADETDDKALKLFQINEFLVKRNEAVQAQSLDGTLTMAVQPDSVDETVMSITKLALPESKWKQPDINPAPIPKYGLNGGAFRIQLASGLTSTRKDSQIDIKFDAIAMWQLVKELGGLNDKPELYLSHTEKEWLELAYQEEAHKLAVFAWQPDIGAWKYLPSSLQMDSKGEKFTRDRYVTLPINENRSDTKLSIEDVGVDKLIAPLGDWVIFFLDADRYKVFLRRGGVETYENLKDGETGKEYESSEFGLRLEIKKLGQDFSFGDVLKLDTQQALDGAVKLESLRSSNRGDGTARVTIMTEDTIYEDSNIAEEWAIFFVGPEEFEIRSRSGDQVRDLLGSPIIGEIGRDVFVPAIGVRVEIHEGRWPFEFGDKFVFKTLYVGTVSAQTDLLGTVTLMQSNDFAPPDIQLWGDGFVPQEGVVIPPRPSISILLSDANGIDVDSFSFLVSVDDRDFRPVPKEDYTFSDRGSGVNAVANVPIFYSPTLNVGKYQYRIATNDLSGNRARSNKGDYLEFMFLVEEQPDLEPPVIEVLADGQLLVAGQVFDESPQFLINIDDDHVLDDSTISFSFARRDSPLDPLRETEYTMTLSDDSSNATITYAPYLMNGEYKLQVSAADISENSAYLSPPETEPLWFRLDEEVTVEGVMNAPNPFSDTTSFSYTLSQPADKVTIKIYTLAGRLVRKLMQDSPGWQYNEEFWDGRDEAGRELASGVYFYRFVVSDADKRIERIGKLAIIR